MTEAASRSQSSSERPAFEAIYADHFAYVWRTLRRFGVAERHLEDVTHDVFVAVHKSLQRYDPSRPLRPWLFGVSFRVASDHLRRASTKREVPTDDIQVQTEPGQHDRAEANERRALLLEALAQVPLDQRAVVVAHDLEGDTAPEIAEGLGVSVNTVYSRLRLGRKRLESVAKRLLETRRGA